MFISSLSLLALLQAPAEVSTKSPFYLFFGVDAGYANLQSDLPTEANKNGIHVQGKALGSYYWEQMTFDLGVGWFYNRLFGSSGAFDRRDISTWAWFAEAAPRYRFNAIWSLGPAVNLYFGTDISFASARQGDSVAVFAGPQLAYEFPLGSMKARLLATMATDITVEDRQVYLGMLGFQLGIPVGNNPEGSAPQKTQRRARAAIPPPEISRMGTELTYSRSWNFDLGSSDLGDEQSNEILKIASVLNAHRGDWKTLVVEGHTDQTGSAEFNRRLSFERAEAVASALEKGGISRSQIEAVSFGSERPLVKEEKSLADQARNRRVVIRIKDARQNSLLENNLTLIK